MLKEKIQTLMKSQMLRNVTKISSGTMLGQAISIVTLPIFTRLYGATVIGYWTLFTSVAVIVNAFSDLGLSNAIMMDDEGEQSEKLFSVITTISFIISLIVGVGYFVIKSVTPDPSGLHPLFYSIVLFVLIFTQQQVNVCYNWLNKKKQYNILMKNPIINNVSVAVIAIPLGLMGFTKYGYYIGLVLGQVFTLFHMRRYLPRIFFDFKFRDHFDVIRSHLTYVKFQMPTYLVAQVKNQAPVFFIRSFFGVEILGYYSVCMRVLNIPVNLLASSIGKVYYQTAAEMKKKGQEVGDFTFRNIKRAMYVAIAPMIVIMSFGDIVCTLFLGNDYVITGNLSRIIVFMTFFQFLMMATQGITIVLEKQHYALISGIVQIIGYVAGLSIGKYVFSSLYIAVALMTVVFCVIQIIYFSKLFKIAGVSVTLYLKHVFSTLGLIIVITAVIRITLIALNIVPNL
ncbi:oligosaccharide flippase family protein [Allocoprococcus similis]